MTSSPWDSGHPRLFSGPQARLFKGSEAGLDTRTYHALGAEAGLYESADGLAAEVNANGADLKCQRAVCCLVRHECNAHTDTGAAVHAHMGTVEPHHLLGQGMGSVLQGEACQRAGGYCRENSEDPRGLRSGDGS
mgnify:CR=1 FL=1